MTADDLVRAGLPRREAEEFRAAAAGAAPPATPAPGSLAADTEVAARFHRLGAALLARLPAKPARTAPQQEAAAGIVAAQRTARQAFLRAHGDAVYEELTAGYTRALRVDELVYAAAERFPGLTPARPAVTAERECLQRDKDGVEIDQGLFLAHVLARPRAGAHLVWAMQRPKPESLERLARFRETGAADLGVVEVRREGQAGHVLIRNLRFLNAEDDPVTAALETGTDLVLLDPACEVGVLRGAPLDHPRYRGRRVFQAGINLTHLYHGKISLVDFFIVRELGFINKIYRGLSRPAFHPGEVEDTDEKPWIAAVEAFAIGGGCQLLLVMDRVIAERGAYFNLPARKEGIIPGLANLRMPRLVGERLARQGIFFERQFAADSPEGLMLCDEVVEPGEMDAAIARTVDRLTGSGTVSAAANRKALRVGQEPLDTFRMYMATYAREQAFCHYSPALVANLERFWNAQQRRP